MLLPTKKDYIQIITTLVAKFEKEHPAPKRRGRLFTYSQKLMIVFFILMPIKRLFCFKAQRRWLETHKEEAKELGFSRLPHRTTLSRRYKELSGFLEPLIEYGGKWAEGLGEEFSSHSELEDKSLFKAQGPVWHQKDKEAGHIPKGLRNLDPDASWSKSASHGWVYGYGLHLTVNSFSVPQLAKVETGSVSESKVFTQKVPFLLKLSPEEVIGDDAYTNLNRTEYFARAGIALVTPALRLGDGPKAKAYKNFINQPENKALLRGRKRIIEPAFDLISKVSGTLNNHKQLPVKRLGKVRSFLLLSVFIVQVAMVANSVWHLPLREISHLMAVMT